MSTKTSKFITNLQFISDELKKVGVLKNQNDLTSFTYSCNKNMHFIHVPNVIFMTDTFNHARPTKVADSKLILDAKMKYVEEDGNITYEELQVNIQVEAKSVNGEPLKTSWHLDMHQYNATKSLCDHPHFHLQHGGFCLTKEANFQTGNYYLLDAPRIKYHPMDIITSIDFTLSNFACSKWQDLKRDSNHYSRIVSESYNDFVYPYLVK